MSRSEFHDVLPERHAANAGEPSRHDGDTGEVYQPNAPKRPVAAGHALTFDGKEAADRPDRADQKAAQHRCIEPCREASRRAKAVPSLLRPILAFRIVQRIGQPRIGVVGKVAGPVTLEREP
jgi:hypothetical protein